MSVKEVVMRVVVSIEVERVYWMSCYLLAVVFVIVRLVESKNLLEGHRRALMGMQVMLF